MSREQILDLLKSLMEKDAEEYGGTIQEIYDGLKEEFPLDPWCIAYNLLQSENLI